MAYMRDKIISRPGYSGFGSWTDTIGDIAKGAVNFFGAQQRAAGAQEALQQSNQQLIAAQAAQSQGPSTTVLVAGAAGVGLIAYLLLRKKKG